MKLLSIRLECFRQHAESEIEFPEEGIIGLVGQNESGKSTVLEAAVFALYGTRATRGTKDSIRWTHAPARSPARVELTFEVGGTTYRVDRSETDATLYAGEQIIAEGISGVDDRVPEVVGMTLEEFESTHLARQKDLSRLQEMGGTAKRQFVLSVMGMDRIDEALTDCRARKNELRTEVDGMRQGLGERDPLEEEVEEASSEVESLREKVEWELADRVGVCEAAHAQAETLLSESSERREKYEETRRRGREARREAKAAGEELERAEEKLEKAREADQSFEDRLHEVADLPDLRQERDDLREARSRQRERETLEGVAQGHREKMSDLRESLDTVEVKIRKLEHQKDPEARLSAAKEGLSDARDHLDRLSEGDKVAAIRSHMEPGEPCPVCEQLVTEVPDPSAAVEALREARKDRDRAREAVQEATAQVDALEDARAERDRLCEQIETAESDLRDAESRLRNLDVPAFDATRLAQVEGEIERMEQVEGELRELKAKADRVPELEADVERWSEKATEAKERERRALEQLEALDFDDDHHQALEERAKERREAAQEAREALSRTRTRLEAAEGRLGRARSSLEAWEERADRLYELEANLTLHEQTAERLADFRHAEAASIRPELEELTSAFLSLLTDGRHEAVTLTEDFDLVVQETGGEMEVISGGAEDVAAIAMRLAISQLIAERAGHPLSLLILDEPFGSLDAVRRGNVLELIRKLGGVFSQVILVTHVEEVQDSVDHAMRVEFDESSGRSRVIQGPRHEEAAA